MSKKAKKATTKKVKTAKSQKSTRGRPRLEIDETMLLNLAKIHCTNEEMASVLGCSADTLERNYAGTIKRGKDDGKKSLRRKLFELAEKGNLGALIWLSKQHLGMKDVVENISDSTPVVRIEWQDEVEGAQRNKNSNASSNASSDKDSK